MREKLYLFLLSALAVFSPLAPILFSVGFLILADFIVGLYRAKVRNETITSRKMSNTISKMVLYQIMIISLFILETFLLDKVIPLTKMGAVFIALVEIKSISESIEMITGVNIWKKVIEAIRRGTNNTKDLLNEDHKL
jgi:hypothetical protein